MKKPLTKEIIKQNKEYYESKQYDKLLEFYKTEATNYDISDQFIQLRKAFYSLLLNDTAQALDILEYAVFDLGYWYQQSTMKSDSFKALFDKQRYKNILKTCQERYESESYGKIIDPIILPAKEDSKQLNKYIMLVHGNDPFVTDSVFEKEKQNARLIYDILEGEYTVVGVYSSRLNSTGKSYWFDYEEGAKEIQRNIKIIKTIYGIEEKDIILVGASAGSGVILKGIFSEIIHPKKIALTIPHIPFVEEHPEKVEILKENNIKIYIMTGENDFCKEYADRLSKELNNINYSHKYTVYENCEHGYPEDPSPIVKEIAEYLGNK